MRILKLIIFALPCLLIACDLLLNPISGSLIVTVLDENSASVQGAVVRLVDDRKSKTTDISGKVTFNEVDPGKHDIVIKAEGFEKYRTTIEVSGHETSEESVVLSNQRGTIVFRLKDPDYNPIEGVSITIQPEDSTVTTDADGEASFAGVRIGDHPYYIPSALHEECNGSVTVTANQTTIKSMILFFRTGSVSVTVVDNNANAIAGAVITLLPFDLHAVAARNGTASIQGVPVGEHTCLVQASVFIDKSDTLLVRVDEDTHELVTLSAGPLLNTRIAFTTRGTGNQEVCVIKPDGSAISNLTMHILDDVSPAWSPDGSRITFASTRGGEMAVFTMNADGTAVTRITHDTSSDSHPDWSPNGSQIAFCGDRDGNRDVYVVDVDGSNLVRLTTDAGDDGLPAWSPDGSRIAFFSEQDGQREIYVMNADGSNQVRLTNHPEEDIQPAWHPGGLVLAFESNRNIRSDIYLINADGSDLTRLTSHSGDDRNPHWSPDGRKLVFVSGRNGNRALWIMNADGTVRTQLTYISGDEVTPHWSCIYP